MDNGRNMVIASQRKYLPTDIKVKDILVGKEKAGRINFETERAGILILELQKKKTKMMNVGVSAEPQDRGVNMQSFISHTALEKEFTGAVKKLKSETG